jgi:hypothetical protein
VTIHQAKDRRIQFDLSIGIDEREAKQEQSQDGLSELDLHRRLLAGC